MTLAKNMMLINRFRINNELSQGGMGTVYHAFDTNLQTPVAIKVNAFQSKQAAMQFEREALILAKLRHPSLPRVIQHFQENDNQFLVMDFIEGQDLWQIIRKQRRPLSNEQAITCIMQICDAVTYLHNQSPPIIHRDIKPQNIKITPDGHAVLVDFGIAKEQISGEKTMTGAQGVTPGFSPPEQYGGSGGTGSFSDIYSLGATLYALIAGQAPPDSIQLMMNKQKFAPVNIDPNINPKLSQTIGWAMELQTTQRPSTVQLWQQRLQQFHTPKDATSTPSNPLATLKTVKTPVKATQVSLVDEQGRKYIIEPQKRLLIGRLSSCDIQVNSPKVSRRHASVAMLGQSYYLYDEGSSNGTFINGQKVAQKGAEFRPGDVISIGRGSELRVEQTTVSTPSPAMSEAAQPTPAAVPLSTSPASDGPKNWDDTELGGIAGMTQMLTINIAKKVEGMSNIQIAALAIGLIGGMVLATLLGGNFIRVNFPSLWLLFPFYYIAGPLAYIFSQRKGTAALVHIPTHIFILAITLWPNIPYLAIILSGIIGGATMEGLFAITKLPDWVRYPGGVTLANAFSLLVLVLTQPQTNYRYGEVIGALLVGFFVYFISQTYKGVQKARTTLRS